MLPGVRASSVRENVEIDYVTHDILKFFNLLLKRSGYVLEQLYSPLIVCTSPEHEELKYIARHCITRHHVHHYLGFAETQWGLFEKESPPRIKPLLYVFRILLTGIYLMQTGEVEANLSILNEKEKIVYLPELIARKTGGSEHELLSESEKDFYRKDFELLRARLEAAGEESSLPETAGAHTELNDLVIRLASSFK